MSSEETPLLSTNSDRNDVYLRFSPTRKKIILVTVSACGLLNCMSISVLCNFYPYLLKLVFVVGTFTPSIPQIAEDLNTTGAVIK